MLLYKVTSCIQKIILLSLPISPSLPPSLRGGFWIRACAYVFMPEYRRMTMLMVKTDREDCMFVCGLWFGV